MSDDRERGYSDQAAESGEDRTSADRPAVQPAPTATGGRSDLTVTGAL
ncbi:MAG: hypothetical protein AAGC55_32650 [Myxococcota bacterium]